MSATALSRQLWVRGPASRLGSAPRATAIIDGLSAAVAEGDQLQLWSGSTGQWVEAVAEEVLEETRRVESGTVVPAGSLRVASVAGTDEFVLPDQTVRRIRKACRISLIAPGGGVDGNGLVYAELDRDARFQVDVVGRKSTLYDRYPEDWQGGAAAPNLASFGEDLIRIQVSRQTDCFIFGSRGGQVVLPMLWQALGDDVPPSVVINGGCAMSLPGPKVPWPNRAVTILLLGGQDFFRGTMPAEEYVASACRMVAPGNNTTAVLYVPEMTHMPQPKLLGAVLSPLVLAALAWRPDAPQGPALELLQAAAGALVERGWGGELRYTVATGAWQQMLFGPQVPDRPPAPLSPRVPKPPQEPPWVELGTAVSVLPLAAALAMTPEGHRELAEQARQEADGWAARVARARALDPESAAEARRVQRRLLELSAGQEGEAYALEGDLSVKRAKAETKQRRGPAPPAQPQRQPQPPQPAPRRGSDAAPAAASLGQRPFPVYHPAGAGLAAQASAAVPPRPYPVYHPAGAGLAAQVSAAVPPRGQLSASLASYRSR